MVIARVAGRWAQLASLSCPGCTAKVKYSNSVVPLFRELNDTIFTNNALHTKTLDQLANTPRDVLRWHISTDPSRKELPKSILRSALATRWRNALRQALQESGYTPEGRQRWTGKQGIVGTLEMAINGGLGLNTSIKELVQQCKTVIKVLEGRQPVYRQPHL